MDNIAVSNSLPEGAVPLEDHQVSVAETVAIGAAPKIVPNFTPRKPKRILLPDGRTVLLAPPKAAVSQFYGRILKDVKYADEKLLGLDQMKVKALLHVADIDHVPVEKPNDSLARFKLEQDLGDDGVDLVVIAFAKHFPPMDESQLVIVGES